MTTSLIHVGLAKTATTYLQKAVFPQARGVNYLGKPFHTPGQAVLQSLSQRRWCVPLDRFLKDEAALRSQIPDNGTFPVLQKQLRRPLCAKKRNIWSHEGILRPTRDDADFRPAQAEDWNTLWAIISDVYPDAWIDSLVISVKASRENAEGTFRRLIRHQRTLETLDLARLYPENDRHLHRAAR